MSSSPSRSESHESRERADEPSASAPENAHGPPNAVLLEGTVDLLTPTYESVLELPSLIDDESALEASASAPEISFSQYLSDLLDEFRMNDALTGDVTVAADATAANHNTVNAGNPSDGVGSEDDRGATHSEEPIEAQQQEQQEQQGQHGHQLYDINQDLNQGSITPQSYGRLHDGIVAPSSEPGITGYTYPFALTADDPQPHCPYWPRYSMLEMFDRKREELFSGVSQGSIQGQMGNDTIDLNESASEENHNNNGDANSDGDGDDDRADEGSNDNDANDDDDEDDDDNEDDGEDDDDDDEEEENNNDGDGNGAGDENREGGHQIGARDNSESLVVIGEYDEDGDDDDNNGDDAGDNDNDNDSDDDGGSNHDDGDDRNGETATIAATTAFSNRSQPDVDSRSDRSDPISIDHDAMIRDIEQSLLTHCESDLQMRAMVRQVIDSARDFGERIGTILGTAPLEPVPRVKPQPQPQPQPHLHPQLQLQPQPQSQPHPRLYSQPQLQPQFQPLPRPHLYSAPEPYPFSQQQSRFSQQLNSTPASTDLQSRLRPHLFARSSPFGGSSPTATTAVPEPASPPSLSYVMPNALRIHARAKQIDVVFGARVDDSHDSLATHQLTLLHDAFNELFARSRSDSCVFEWQKRFLERRHRAGSELIHRRGHRTANRDGDSHIESDGRDYTEEQGLPPIYIPPDNTVRNRNAVDSHGENITGRAESFDRSHDQRRERRHRREANGDNDNDDERVTTNSSAHARSRATRSNNNDNDDNNALDDNSASDSNGDSNSDSDGSGSGSNSSTDISDSDSDSGNSDSDSNSIVTTATIPAVVAYAICIEAMTTTTV